MAIPTNIPTEINGPHRIIVCGPIGAGKSTVTRTLAAMGVVVVEADAAGHAVLAPGGSAFAAVSRRWPQVVGSDGLIDRSVLAGIVFADPESLADLESITHPAIRTAIEAAVHAAGDADVVVEVPLLKNFLGQGWKRLVVVADDVLRLQRAIERGMEEADVRRRMANQPPYDVWEAAGDWVLLNNADLETLRAATIAWWESLR